MSNENKYGVATVGLGTSQEREIPIEQCVKSLYKDNRLVSIVKLEDDSFILSVENPGSSGRATQTSMWLSRESFISLIFSKDYIEAGSVFIINILIPIIKILIPKTQRK